MTVSTMLIFCLIVAGHFVSYLHWSIILARVMCVWSFHSSVGTSCMPKYTGSFWCKIGSGWFL
jgi:hypothetical protein